MTKTEPTCSSGNTTQAFLLGLIVGCAAAVVLAPLSGPDFRRTLKSKAQQGYDSLNESLADATEAAQALADEGAKLVAQGKERVRAEASRLATAVEAGRIVYSQTGPETQNI